MTVEEKRQRIVKELAGDKEIEQAYEKLFGKEEQVKSFTPADILEAGAEAMTRMVLENPARILIHDDLTSAIALTARFLFHKDDEKKGESNV